MELKRPRGSASFDLQKLHAKHASAARVQRTVMRVKAAEALCVIRAVREGSEVQPHTGLSSYGCIVLRMSKISLATTQPIRRRASSSLWPSRSKRSKVSLVAGRIQLPNLVFDDLEDSLIQALVNLHPDLPIFRSYPSPFGQRVKAHNVRVDWAARHDQMSSPAARMIRRLRRCRVRT